MLSDSSYVSILTLALSLFGSCDVTKMEPFPKSRGVGKLCPRRPLGGVSPIV